MNPDRTASTSAPRTAALGDIILDGLFASVAFVLVGVLCSWLMSIFDRFPIMFFVLLVLFLCLMIGFFGLDVALGTSLLGRLRAWTVVVANLLAAAVMALYQWRRHPGALRGVERLWEHES